MVTSSPEGAATGDHTSASWLVVDLDTVARNFQRALECAGHGGYAVVKANAYGHGAVAVARHLEGCFVPEELHGFMVARVSEAEELRRSDVRSPVIVLGCFPSALGPEGAEATLASARRWRWEPVVSTTADLDFWRSAAERGEDVRVHVEVDTGMQRTGLAPSDVERVEEARRSGVEVLSAFTHFIESEEYDAGTTDRQTKAFQRLASEHTWMNGVRLHLDNSAALRRPRAERANSVEAPGFQCSFRCGGGLYGLDLAAEAGQDRIYRPALEVWTRLVQVRLARAGTTVGYSATWKAEEDRWIGTVPIGYADGLSRATTGLHLLVGDQLRPMVGRISMDLSTIDLGAATEPPPRVGTEVQVLGDRPGLLDAATLADHAGSLSYEVTCRFGARLPQRHRKASVLVREEVGAQ